MVILAVGLYSHFQSAWVKAIIRIPGFGEIRPYVMCNKRTDDKNCPHIALETFYIIVILATFAVSLVGLIMSNLIDLRQACCRLLVL